MIIDLSHWEWPQITVFVMYSMTIVNNIYHHGEKKQTEYNAIGTIIAIVLNVIILTKGGFFR